MTNADKDITAHVGKIKCRQNMTAHLAKIKRRPTLFKLTRNTSSKLDRVNEQCTHVGITIIH